MEDVRRVAPPKKEEINNQNLKYDIFEYYGFKPIIAKNPTSNSYYV